MPGYFSFHEMVSGSLIKAIYLAGLITITIVGIALIVVGAHETANAGTDSLWHVPVIMGNGNYNVIAGALLLVAGNLFWRLVCEAWILIFSIHELLASIDRRLERE